MKYQKFNKYEKKEVRKQAIDTALSGKGLYLYQNSSSQAELTLPRPTQSGVRKVGPNQQFQGDDYFMQLVRSGLLRLIEVLYVPEQEETMSNEKLILDQPDTVTETGTVEHVIEKSNAKPAKATKKVNEITEESKPVLLNEGPDDDGFVIVA